MKIRVQLNVKVRAFFINIAKFDREWTFPIEGYGLAASVVRPQHILNFNDKGVRLLVELVR